MTAKEYIYKNLQKLANLFNNLTFTYEYKEILQTHVVEVKPEFEFSLNDDYIDAEIDLTSEFDELFYPESILFISENSLTTITEVEKVFKFNQFTNKTEMIRMSNDLVFSDFLSYDSSEHYSIAA
jgi:hypothetical protein